MQITVAFDKTKFITPRCTPAQLEALRVVLEFGLSAYEKIHYPLDGGAYLEVEEMVKAFRGSDTHPKLVGYPGYRGTGRKKGDAPFYAAAAVAAAEEAGHHPDEWRPAQPWRDRQYLLVGRSDALILLPVESEGERRGSPLWGLARAAMLLNKPVVVIRPRGSTELWQPEVVGEDMGLAAGERTWSVCAVCGKNRADLWDEGAPEPLLVSINGNLLCPQHRSVLYPPRWWSYVCSRCGERNDRCACLPL